jgi:cytochrome P450
MAIYSIHRNPEYWEEPDAFRPSRFDARVSPPVSPHHFLPFSLGRRSCIGSRFAQVEGVTALAKIMRKFTIHLPTGTRDPNFALLGVGRDP